VNRSRHVCAVEITAILLFFLQSVRGLFSGMFAVMYRAIISHEAVFLAPVAVGVLLLFCVLPAIFPPKRLRSPLALLVTAAVVYASRIFVMPSEHLVTLFSCLIVFAATGMYIRAVAPRGEFSFPHALVTAIVVDMLFRVAGNTYDVTLRQSWLPCQIVISAGLLILSLALFRKRRSAGSPEASQSFGFPTGLAFGTFLFLETSLFAMPNAVARWSVVDYVYVVPMMLLCTLFPLLRWAGQTGQLPGGGDVSRAAFLIMASAIGGLVLGHVTRGGIALTGLVVAQGAIVIAFLSGSRRLDVGGRSGLTGRSVGLGLLVFVGLNFAYSFTFTYAYLGPLRFFRGLGLAVFLLAVVMATWPARRRQINLGGASLRQGRRSVAVTGVAFGITLLGTVLSLPPRMSLPTRPGVIRVGTYNIHYGYDGDWRYRLSDMAETIKESGADIVFLQEVDACRVTSYGVDNAMWLARKLKMNVVYQPTMEHLTGIATLSRFPIVRSEGRLLPRRRDEQTAIVLAQVRIGDDLLNTYGTWFGLSSSERRRQLPAALEFVGGGAAVLGGDMNLTMNDPLLAILSFLFATEKSWEGSRVYWQLIHRGFRDPFIEGDFPPADTEPAKKPDKRPDCVWIRGLEANVVDARVLPSTASDHRMVVVALALE